MDEHTARERVISELEAARDEIRNARGVLIQACSRVVCSDLESAAACLQGLTQSLRHLDEHLDTIAATVAP